MLSANAVASQYKELSNGDKEIVANLISHLHERNKPRRMNIYGILGIVSSKLQDIFPCKNVMSDDEVDDFISAIRADQDASRNSN